MTPWIAAQNYNGIPKRFRINLVRRGETVPMFSVMSIQTATKSRILVADIASSLVRESLVKGDYNDADTKVTSKKKTFGQPQ